MWKRDKNIFKNIKKRFYIYDWTSFLHKKVLTPMFYSLLQKW